MYLHGCQDIHKGVANYDHVHVPRKRCRALQKLRSGHDGPRISSPSPLSTEPHLGCLKRSRSRRHFFRTCGRKGTHKLFVNPVYRQTRPPQIKVRSRGIGGAQCGPGCVNAHALGPQEERLCCRCAKASPCVCTRGREVGGGGSRGVCFCVCVSSGPRGLK